MSRSLPQKLEEPTVGQIYQDPFGTPYKITEVNDREVKYVNLDNISQIYSEPIEKFRNLGLWELVQSGGKSKKRRRKNKRRTARSGKIRKFFGF